MPRILSQTGNLVVVDFGGPGPLLNKKQVSSALGYSERWTEMRVSEGMPSSLDGRGRRRFSLAECRAWLDDHGRGAQSG